MNNEKIIEKIKGLLALGDASKNCEEKEAQAALLKAHEFSKKLRFSCENRSFCVFLTQKTPVLLNS